MIKEPVREIIAAIERAAARWDSGAVRAQMLDAVAARTGYGVPTVERGFDSIFGWLTADRIEAVIADELGCLDVLDRFVERERGFRARALPLGRVCIISSQTTIGVAIIPAVFALCAKCNVLVKDREDRFVSAFLETLGDELPDFRRTARARPWDGQREMQDLTGFDAVVAFGNDVTLDRIARGLDFRTRFIPYGSKASAGYVTRESLASSTSARNIAHGAAIDLMLYETEGCLSLHVLLVESGGAITPAEFAQMLGDAIRSSEVELPLGRRDVHQSVRLATARDLALFRSPDPGRVHSDSSSTYLVVLDPPWDEPPFFLPRALAIRSVEQSSQAAAYFRRHSISLEALAVAGDRPDVVQVAQSAGASRICNLGEMQHPPLGTFHGGRPRIAEFVRWLTDERAVVEA
jgi:Acyl-CoA reductase (LuxC)